MKVFKGERRWLMVLITEQVKSQVKAGNRDTYDWSYSRGGQGTKGSERRYKHIPSANLKPDKTSNRSVTVIGEVVWHEHCIIICKLWKSLADVNAWSFFF